LTSANKTGGAEFGNESAVFKAFGSPAPAAFNSPTPALNASMLLIQSESTDTNTSQEEVDPKSQLANKTIFKTDNPNLSIIEINDNSIKEEDLEKVVLVEGDSVKNLLKKSPSKDTAANADKRRRKESLLQTSKQKLDENLRFRSFLPSKRSQGRAFPPRAQNQRHKAQDCSLANSNTPSAAKT